MPATLRAKCLIVGDTTVGKSAITQVYHSDGSHFPKNYTMTTSVELCTKTVNVGAHANSDSVELFLCDSAGKGIFQDVVQLFWDHPNMIMIVFDVTSESSFHAVSKWLELIEEARRQKCDVAGVLVGNKTDLVTRRVVLEKEAQDMAASKGLEYFDVSAKEMQNVDAPFLHLAKTYYQQYLDKVDAIKHLC